MSDSMNSAPWAAGPAKLHRFRSYSANSPEAKARVIALALLADGRLDSQELDHLSRRDAFRRLGLTREDFFQVLYDCCADLSTATARDECYLLTPEILADLFSEISEPGERNVLLGLIFDVIRCDGRLHLGEARLFWTAADAWCLAPITHPARARGRNLRRRPFAPSFAMT